MVVDVVYETVGPFAIPVALFVLGLTAYGLLAAIQRWLSAGDENTTNGQNS